MKFISKRKLVRATAILMLAVALSGCRVDDDTSAPIADEGSPGYLRLKPAPADVPVVLANETKLAVAQFHWWVDGQATEQVVTDPATVPVPEVKIDKGILVYVLKSGVVPYQLIVTLFSELDTDGIPTSNTGDQIDCLKSTRCKVTGTENMLTVSLIQVPTGVVAMLHVAYLKLIDEGGSGLDAPTTLSASWTLRTASGD